MKHFGTFQEKRGSNYLEMVCRQGERGVKLSGHGMPTEGEGVDYFGKTDDVIYGRPLIIQISTIRVISDIF